MKLFSALRSPMRRQYSVHFGVKRLAPGPKLRNEPSSLFHFLRVEVTHDSEKLLASRALRSVSDENNANPSTARA